MQCLHGQAGRRITKVTEHKAKIDRTHFIDDIASQYAAAERITLVMDKLNTHTPASLCKAFPHGQAQALWDRFSLADTPKPGSWLNMAEIELNVMIAQCLNRLIDNIDTLRCEVAAWQAHRDHLNTKIDWQFTADKARVKLKRLYPTYMTGPVQPARATSSPDGRINMKEPYLRTSKSLAPAQADC